MQSTTGPNNPLGLNLDFLYGRGYLWAEAHPINDWLTLENFRMEIPGLKFPFQSSEGLSQFRHTRCLARVVELSISEKRLRRLFARATKSITGFYDIDFSFLNGTIEVSARVRTLKFETLITFQIGVITPEPPDSDHIELSIFDYRAYGPLPVSNRIVVSDLITKLLSTPEFSAITGGSFSMTRNLDVLRIRPLKLSLLHLFTRCGWKMPDLTDINRIAVNIRPGRFSLLATRHGEEPFLKPKGTYLNDSQLYSEALAEYETKKLLASAEERIFEQEFELAIRDLESTHDSLGDHPGVVARLLDLLLAAPSVPNQAYANQILDRIESTDLRELALRSRITLAYLDANSQKTITQAFLTLDQFLLRQSHEGATPLTFNHGILLFALARHLEKIDANVAIEFALRSQELLPGCVSVHYLLDTLFSRLERPKEREDILRRLVELELDPARTIQLLLTLSELLIYDLDRPNEAKPYLENARKLTKNPKVDELTAEIFIRNQSYTRAIKTLTASADQLDPVANAIPRALLFEKIGLIWFQHLYNPAQANIFILKAQTCLGHAEKTNANSMFLQLLEAKFHLSSANICISRGQSNEALNHLSKIFALFDFEPNLVRFSEHDTQLHRGSIGSDHSVSILAEATLRQAVLQNRHGRPHAARNAYTKLFNGLRPNDYPSIKPEIIAQLALLWLELDFSMFKAELLTAAFAKFSAPDADESPLSVELGAELARNFLNSRFVSSLKSSAPRDPNVMFDSSDDTPISTNQQLQAIAFCVSAAEKIITQATSRQLTDGVESHRIVTTTIDDIYASQASFDSEAIFDNLDERATRDDSPDTIDAEFVPIVEDVAEAVNAERLQGNEAEPVVDASSESLVEPMDFTDETRVTKRPNEDEDLDNEDLDDDVHELLTPPRPSSVVGDGVRRDEDDLGPDDAANKKFSDKSVSNSGISNRDAATSHVASKEDASKDAAPKNVTPKDATTGDEKPVVEVVVPTAADLAKDFSKLSKDLINKAERRARKGGGSVQIQKTEKAEDVLETREAIRKTPAGPASLKQAPSKQPSLKQALPKQPPSEPPSFNQVSLKPVPAAALSAPLRATSEVASVMDTTETSRGDLILDEPEVTKPEESSAGMALQGAAPPVPQPVPQQPVPQPTSTATPAPPVTQESAAKSSLSKLPTGPPPKKRPRPEPKKATPASIRATLTYDSAIPSPIVSAAAEDSEFSEEPTAETQIEEDDEHALVLFREKLLATSTTSQEWSRDDVLGLAGPAAAIGDVEPPNAAPVPTPPHFDIPSVLNTQLGSFDGHAEVNGLSDDTIIEGLFQGPSEPAKMTAEEEETYHECNQVIQEARLNRNHPQLADAIERILELNLKKEESLNFRKELGELYFYDLEDNENARFHLERVRNLDPENRGKNRTLLTALETIYEESNQPEDRLEILKIRLESAENEEKSNVYRLLIARLVWDTYQNADDAKSWIQPLLLRDPHDEAANRLLAELAVDQENWEAAAKHLLTVLETSAGGLDAVETRRKLAEIYLRHLGDANSARNHYLEVLSDAPGDSNAIHELRECYRQLSDWDGVCGTLLTELGLLAGQFNPIPLSDIGKTVAAIAPALKPAAADVLTEFAYLLEEQLGDLAKAFYIWTMILEILPDNMDALDHHMLLARILDRPRDLADDLVLMTRLISEPSLRADMILEAIELYHSFGTFKDTVAKLFYLFETIAMQGELPQELLERAYRLRREIFPGR